MDPRGNLLLAVGIAVLTLALPATVVVLFVTDLVSTVTNTALEPTAESLQTVLFLFSLPCLVQLLKQRWPVSSHDNSDYRNNLDNVLLSIYPCKLYGFLGVLCVIGLASLVLPVFNVYAIASCFPQNNTFTSVIEFIMNLLKVVFLLLQMVFIVKSVNCGERSTRTLVYTAIVISTNICLGAEGLYTTAKQSIDNIQQNITGEAYNHAFCELQSPAIGKAYRSIDRYMYSFIFHFCAYSVELLYVTWASTDASGQAHRTRIADRPMRAEYQAFTETSSILQQQPPSRSFLDRLKNTFCVKLCRYSYLPTIVICIVLFVIHVLPAIGNDDGLAWTISIYMNIMSGAAFLSFLIIRRDSFSRENLLPKHILLAFAGFLFFALTVTESVYAIYNMTSNSTVSVNDIFLFALWNIFHFLGLIFQTLFLIRVSDIDQLDYNSNKYVYLYGLVWFLTISNFEMFCENSALPQRVMKHVANSSSDRALINVTYNILLRILNPGASLYRLQSCLLSLEIIQRLKQDTGTAVPVDNDSDTTINT